MESLVRINTSVCFVLGHSLNALLAYFILKHSTAELRIYARILQQTVVVNSLYLCMVFAFGPICVSSPFGSMYYGVGPLARTAMADGVIDESARAWNITLYIVWIYTVYAIQFTVGAQFIFRYRALCYGKVMSGREYAAVLAVTLVLSAVCIPLLVLSNSSLPPPVGIFDAVGMPYNANIALATLNLSNTGLSSLVFSITTSLAVALYALIAGCSVRVWLYMRRALADLPAESRVQVSQINVIFVVQAVVPTVFDFLPTMLIRILGAIHLSPGPYTTTYALIFFNWGPLVNALAVFGVVKPYRKGLMEMLKRPCRGISPVTVKPLHSLSALFTIRPRTPGMHS